MNLKKIMLLSTIFTTTVFAPLAAYASTITIYVTVEEDNQKPE